MVTAVYPGTFDPLTRGHEDLVRRASGLFDTLIVGVADSKSKRPFFSLEERLGIANEVLGHVVAQPVAGAGHDLDMLGPQPDFLVQFTEHRLLGRLAVLDAPLRELPGVGAQALAPKDLVVCVQQDNADVGPEPFTVEHNRPSNSLLISLLHCKLGVRVSRFPSCAQAQSDPLPP